MIKSLFAARRASGLPRKSRHFAVCGCAWLAAAMTGSGAVTGGDWVSSGLYNGPAPAEITVPSDVTQIASGFNHSVALKQDGSVVAWGRKNYDTSAVVPAIARSGVI